MAQIRLNGGLVLSKVRIMGYPSHDWGFVYRSQEYSEDYGLITQPVTVQEDYGLVTEPIIRS